MGAPLKGTIRSDGSSTTMNGGTAILAPPEISQAFSSESDATGLYTSLFNTHRANACWIQVTPSQRALVFCVYAKTAASANQQVFDFNDDLFSNIFLIAAQFGQVPVIIAGDFQSNPLHYPSISNAVNFNDWFDPLSTTDAAGEVCRPLTYSKDGSFSGSGDFCSSIDGILVNKVAHSALQSMYVVDTVGSQHRAIRATFSWRSIRLHGYVHCKFAPLNTAHLDKPGCNPDHPSNQHAKVLWESGLEVQFNNLSSPEDKWKIVNDLCVQTLVKSGTTWGHGEHSRGLSPKFSSKQFCPGQSRFLTALTLKGSWLQNSLARLRELYTRLQRPFASLKDFHVFQRTTTKVRHTLSTLKCPFLWLVPQQPTLLDVYRCITWVQYQLDAWDFSKRQARIKSWKSRIKESAHGDKKYIFHHLRNKVLDEPTNLVTDIDNNIVCQPNAALSLINDQWDSIFSSNALHEDPIQVLQVAWPYLSSSHEPWSMPPLTAQELATTIAHRNPDAAAGLDGWRTTDLQHLPLHCLEVFANFFLFLENLSGGDIPSTLVCAKQAILNKAGPASPLNKRLITILSPILLAYTGTRFRQLQEWQNATLHSSLFGGIRGRSMSSVSNGLRIDIDIAQESNDHLVGIKLDQSKCFDRIIPTIAGAFMLALGVPKGVVNLFLMMYRGLHKHLSYRGWISKNAVTNANGVAQGCSLSLLAINSYMHVWATFIEHIPHVVSRVFIDDAYLWVKLNQIHLLQTALQTTELWGSLVGQQLNPQKSVLWATSPGARKQAKQLFPHLPLHLEFDVLGAKTYTSPRDSYIFDTNKCYKIVADIKNIANLPIGRTVKEHLIGSKVLPQLTFASHISKIPKKHIEKIQSEIAQVFWGGRPHWRSKMLIFALLTKPHRVEPFCARAYCCVLDFWRLLHVDSTAVEKCRRLLSGTSLAKHSLLYQVQTALNVFKLSLSPVLELVFGDIRIPALHLGVRDIKVLLQHLAIQSCYEKAACQTRKDLCKPEGFFGSFPFFAPFIVLMSNHKTKNLT